MKWSIRAILTNTALALVIGLFAATIFSVPFQGRVGATSPTDNGTSTATQQTQAQQSSGGSSQQSGSGSGTDTQTNNNADTSCDSSGLSLSWLLCPFVAGIAKSVDWLYTNVIEPLLKVPPISLNTSDKTFKAWSAFRVYGDIFLVIALLVVVFGESIGGGLLDAYTVKKMLPRLVAAAVLINISYYLVAIAVDISNIVGAGLISLITQPFGISGDMSLRFNLGTDVFGLGAIAALVGTLIVGGGAAVMWIFVFIILPLLFIVLGIFVIVLLRRALIIFLVIVSPVAFALYALPNTENVFRRWWKMLFETLLVYPIVAALFGLAKVSAVLISQASGTGWAMNSIGGIIAIIALMVPLALIPFAFKIAGGVIGKATDLALNYSKRAHQGILGNPNDKNSLRNKVKRGAGDRYTRRQANVVDRGRELDATRRAKFIGNVVDRFGNVDARLARYNAIAREQQEEMSSTGRDALRYAGAGYKLTRGQMRADGTTATGTEYWDSKGRQISKNLYDRGKSLYGGNSTQVGQGLEYSFRKAQSDADLRSARFAFSKNAIANNWSQGEAGDVWAASTFAHKDKWLTEWHSQPTVQKDADGKTTGVEFADVGTRSAAGDKAYDSATKELHRTRESFRMSSLRAQDWQAMYDRQVETRDKIRNNEPLTQEEVDRFARTSEILDSMTSRGVVQQNTDGEVMVSGASPEAAKVIEALYKSRGYATAPVQQLDASGQPTDTYSPTDRIIYDVEAADGLGGGGGRGAVGPRMSRDDAVRAAALPGVTAHVSDDRSDIPTNVS